MAYAGVGSGSPALISQAVIQAFVSNVLPQSPRLLASQIVIQAFVNNTAPVTPDPVGVNDGTPVCHPFPVLLDRKVRLQGSYDGGSNITAWTLPIVDESLDTVVLADTAFGSLNGTVLDALNTSGVVTVEGDYTDGEVIIGRRYDMSVELSRPYRRNQRGEAVISDRIAHTVQYFAHRNTGDYTVRVAMNAVPARSDREKAFTVTTVGSLQENGELRTVFGGKAEEARFFVESDSPRPVTITGVKYTIEYAGDHG